MAGAALFAGLGVSVVFVVGGDVGIFVVVGGFFDQNFLPEMDAERGRCKMAKSLNKFSKNISGLAKYSGC